MSGPIHNRGQVGGAEGASQNHAPGDDAVAMMQYQNASKSVGVAYLLWLFLGGLGVHRFYLGKNGTAAIMLLCTLASFIIVFPIIVTVLIGLYDLFTLPSQVRRRNDELIQNIKAGRG